VQNSKPKSMAEDRQDGKSKMSTKANLFSIDAIMGSDATDEEKVQPTTFGIARNEKNSFKKSKEDEGAFAICTAFA